MSLEGPWEHSFHPFLQDDGAGSIARDQVVMLLGGNRMDSADNEIVDLSTGGGICTKPADFPDGVDLAQGAVGAVLDGDVVICGGVANGRHCYGYTFDTQSWDLLDIVLLEERIGAAGVHLPNASWLIIGGRTADGKALSNSELLDKAFKRGPEWPVRFWGHCAAVINKTHAIISGGNNNAKYVKSTYLLSQSANVWNWKWISESSNERYHHVCGSIESIFGTEVVAAGGSGHVLDVDIFSFFQMTWRAGPSLPHTMDLAATIQFGKTFLILGGLLYGDCPVTLRECAHLSKYVYKFDEMRFVWTLEATTMESARGGHIALVIPNGHDKKYCSKNCTGCPGIKSKIFFANSC